MAITANIATVAHRHRRRLAIFLGALVLVLIAAFFSATGIGAVDISVAQALSILLDRIGIPHPWSHAPMQESVLLSIRLPRVCLALLTGAALAASGAALQGLFRNPLADPGLIGVSSGAALTAAATIVLAASIVGHLPPFLAGYILPLAAFIGGLAATLIVYRIANRDGRTEVATMLLAGIALNAIASAGIGCLMFFSDDQQLRDINFWLLGSLGSVTWDGLGPVAPVILIPTVLLALVARQLNALLLGETAALHLGFDVERLKRTIIVLVALCVGASVALTGIIGFVGLVVPHLVRLMIGPDHRALMPASILLGAALLLVADLAARTVVLPAELPISILTSLVGGPFFLWLLVRRSSLRLW